MDKQILKRSNDMLDTKLTLPLDKQRQGKRKWQPSPVFLPGKSQGLRSLVCPWGCKESDTTERLRWFGSLSSLVIRLWVTRFHASPVCFALNRTNSVINLLMDLEAGWEGGGTRHWDQRPSPSLGPIRSGRRPGPRQTPWPPVLALVLWQKSGLGFG